MTERIITDADIIDLKAALGATMDAWVESLEQLEEPAPDPEPTPGPPTNPLAVAGDGRIDLTWDPPEGPAPTGYRYGRDGTDAGGGGPWSGLLPADARTATLDKLVNGRGYLVTLAAVYPSGDVGVSITVTPTGPPASPPVGVAWLSGVADNADTLLKWGSFRGSPATYARVWADSDMSNMLQLPAMQAVTSIGWTGVLDLACGGPSDWASAATGGWDANWRTQCRKALSLWGNLKQLHLSMAHEFNNGYGWQVSQGEQANFKKAWARWYGIVQEELVAKGKDARVVLSCNSDTNSGWTIADGLPDPAHIDIIGDDSYNFWPSTNTQAAWDANKSLWKNGTPRGVQAWIDFAKSIGKPISFPEWGLAPSGPFAVDSPFYVQKMNEVFRSIAPVDPYNPGPGKLAGEAWFNAWSGHGQIYPTATSAAESRAAYVGLRWGSTG